jgi:hypothetical protein
MERVIACGRRLLLGRSEPEWSEETKDAVGRALLDRSDGIAAVEACIRTGRQNWTNRAAFEHWLESLAVEED